MTLSPPWNASWTGESRYEIKPCRWSHGRMAIWQPHNPGAGKPIYAKPHVVRQRRAVAEMRCTVCGERTAEGDRWMFPLGDWRRVEHRRRWTTTETPVHRACADKATVVCPHIRARGFEPFLFPLSFSIVASLIGGPAVERDFGIRIQPGAQVIGALKLSIDDDLVRQHVAPALAAAEGASNQSSPRKD